MRKKNCDDDLLQLEFIEIQLEMRFYYSFFVAVVVMMVYKNSLVCFHNFFTFFGAYKSHELIQLGISSTSVEKDLINLLMKVASTTGLFAISRLHWILE